MRRFLPIALLVLAIAIAAAHVHRSDIVAPPSPSFSVAGAPVDGFVRLDRTLLDLRVAIDAPDPDTVAVLLLHGAEVEAVPFTSREIAFGPVVLPPGDSRVLVEIRRTVGPITSSRWHEFYVGAAPAAVAPTLVVPETVWSRELDVTGTAPPGALVRILVDGQAVPAGDRDGGRTYTDPAGRFAATVALPGPGAHRITAQVDGDAGPLTSDAATVAFSDDLPALVSRKLIVTIDPEGFAWDLQATLLEDDPRAKRLLEGRMSPAAFARAVHGEIRFNRAIYSSAELAAPRLQSAAGRVWVGIAAARIRTSVVRDGRVEIDRGGTGNVRAALDTIELRARGYRLTGFSPPARTIGEDRVIWTGDSTGGAGVAALLQAPPATRSLWRLTPADILPNGAVGPFHNLLALVPILWLLHALRHGFAAAPDPADQRLLRGAALLLGALVTFGSVQYLTERLAFALVFRERAPVPLDEVCGNLTGFGGSCPFALSYLLAYLLAFAVVLVGLALARAVLAGVASNPTVSAVTRDLLRILMRASVYGLMFAALSALVRSSDTWLGLTSLDLVMAPRFATVALCTLIGTLVVRRVWRTGVAVSGRTLAVPGAVALGGLLLLATVTVPHGTGFDPLVDRITDPLYDALDALRRFLSRLGFLAPLVAMLLLCAALANRRRTLDASQRHRLALLLFAGTLVGTGPVWILFPVPLILAVVLFAPVVMMPPDRAALLDANRAAILADRDLLLRRDHENARAYAPTGGFFGLGLFSLRPDDRTRRQQYAPITVTLPDGSKLPASELAFAFGPHPTAVANGLAAARVGLWGAGFFVLVYALPSFVQPPEGDPFPYLWPLVRVISVGGYWLICAFFLGYFYESIRGPLGWKKGAWLALGISLANEPLVLVNATAAADYAAVALSVAQRFAFFILVGLFALDRRTFVKGSGGKVEWRLFPLITGLSIVEASLSVAVAAAGVAISSAFSGQLTTVLAQVAGALMPAIAATPGVGQ